MSTTPKASAHHPKPTPEAWLFVLKHAKVITHVARRFCNGQDPEDFRQSLVIAVAERFYAYDPNKSGPYTWIMYQGMALRTAAQRMSRRRQRIQVRAADEIAAEVRISVSQGGAHLQHQAEVARILEQATPEQRAACLSVLVGHNCHEVEEHLGIGWQGMRNRLTRLGAKLQADNHNAA